MVAIVDDEDHPINQINKINTLESIDGGFWSFQKATKILCRSRALFYTETPSNHILKD